MNIIVSISNENKFLTFLELYNHNNNYYFLFLPTNDHDLDVSSLYYYRTQRTVTPFYLQFLLYYSIL